MKKRAQVTVFIIVAVVIVVVGAGAFLFINNQNQSEAEKYFSQDSVQPTVNNIRASVVDCMNVESENALVTVGYQGGFYNFEPPIYMDLKELNDTFIPYYYYEGEINVPTDEFIEDELGRYVDDGFSECMDEVAYEGYDVSYSKPSTTAELSKGKVQFRIDSSVKVEREGFTLEVGATNEAVELDSSVYEIMEVARYLTSTHNEDSEFYCVNCVTDLLNERNLYIDMSELEDNSVLVTFYENHTTTDYYEFEFLYKYPEGDL
jgi:hypothetical protein